MPERRWLHAGGVGRPHGLDGSFHVNAPRPQLLELGARVFIDGEEFRIVRRAGTDSRPIVRLEGHDDRATIEGLRGRELLFDRAGAPELDKDEWWAEDLEGCAVADGERRLGVVRRLLALPSCEVLEVVGDDGDELLIPLVEDAVRAVDVTARRIEVSLSFLGEA